MSSLPLLPELPRAAGLWGLREEARKSWDHILCDDIVYLAQPLDGDFWIAHVFAEKYLLGDAWLEIIWTIRETSHTGYRHYKAIIEVLNDPLHSSSHMDVDV